MRRKMKTKFIVFLISFAVSVFILTLTGDHYAALVLALSASGVYILVRLLR